MPEDTEGMARRQTRQLPLTTQPALSQNEGIKDKRGIS
jgi:hypothetical protein